MNMPCTPHCCAHCPDVILSVRRAPSKNSISSDAPIPPSIMQSPVMTATTTTESTPSITPASTPPTSEGQEECNNMPDQWPTEEPEPVPTQHFYLDTFFNPVWMPGPYVFSFGPNGTVVQPETIATEPYLGYRAEGTLHDDAAHASHFQGCVRYDPKPWKNVAITEQDDAEWEEMRERMRIGAVGEWGRYSPYHRSQSAMESSTPEQPELVHTWLSHADGDCD